MKKFNGIIKNNMNFNNTPIDWNQVHHVINGANRIMLTTHENPDGDGLGAECGLYHHLNGIGKDIRIVNFSPLPDEYDYLNDGGIFECYEKDYHENWIKNVDLVIVFDVGDYVRIRTIVDAVKTHNLTTMNIDHHPHPNAHPFTHNIVDLSAAATGCMVYDYLKLFREEPIQKESLVGIYSAVMTDTGCFRYSNTDQKCHNIAIECLSAGVETHIIYRQIYENSTRSRMSLMGTFLSNLNYELDGKLAWFTISQTMLKNANATKADVDGFSDLVRTIRGVEVALMVFEQNEHRCRINFRSKGNYAINDIAKAMGGGGHAFAAGAVTEGSLKNVARKAVVESIKSLEQKMSLSQ